MVRTKQSFASSNSPNKAKRVASSLKKRNESDNTHVRNKKSRTSHKDSNNTFVNLDLMTDEFFNDTYVAGRYNVQDITLYRLSDLSYQCNHCPALHFLEEKRKAGINEFFSCCNYGKLSILEDFIPDYPDELRMLFQPDIAKTNCNMRSFHNEFKTHIRSLNSSFSCASLGCMRFRFPDKQIPIFKIQGQVYHSYNTFAQSEGEVPTNGQLYFIDTENALDIRVDSLCIAEKNNKLYDLISYIETFLRNHYIYAKSFDMMHTVCEEAEASKQTEDKVKEVTMLFGIKDGVDLRRYNTPKANEVCAIIWRDSNEDLPPANVIVYPKGTKKLQSIYPLSPVVEPMCYPLFYPTTYHGWNHTMQDSFGKNISLCDFTKYKLFFRQSGKFLPHCYSGKLLQQWTVDQAARIEWARLHYIRTHQKEICKESYSNISKVLQSKAIEMGVQVKKQIMLPTSFTGGPRNLHESFMDAMTIVNEVGRPDLFLTFTCNPNDLDIKENLLPNQQTHDRPDIVARVFRLKIE